MKHLHIIILFLLLTSCRTQTVVLPEVHSRDSLVTRVNTRVDSIREKDSISFSFTELPAISDSIVSIPTIHHWHTRTHDRMITHTDTITIIKTDTITVAVRPTPDPSLIGRGVIRRKSLALSERVRVLGKGCLIGGIGAFVLLFLIRILNAVYLRR